MNECTKVHSLACAHARHMSTIDLPIPSPLIGMTEPRWRQRKQLVFPMFKNCFHLFRILSQIA